MTETLLKPPVYSAPDPETQSNHLLVFDVRNYYRLYQESLVKFSDQAHARQVVFNAVTNDGVGLINEKISSEKEDGLHVFTTQERVAMQLTPATHVYLDKIHSVTGQRVMVPPEFEELEKDIIDTLSDWRRGIDVRAMKVVRQAFFDSEVGDALIWFSPKAEEWEDQTIRKFNGQYGWGYVGVVEQDESGEKKLVVNNFKFGGDTETSFQFLHKAADQVYTEEGNEKGPLLEEVMTTVAKTSGDWDSASVWERLAAVQKEAGGEDKIFNLSVDTILALQDPKLKTRLKSEVATRVADWLADKIVKGENPDILQAQVRKVYIGVTRQVVDLYTREMDLVGGRVYRGRIDSDELRNYSGSEGDFCGTWNKEIKGQASRFNLEVKKWELHRGECVDPEHKGEKEDQWLGPCDICIHCEERINKHEIVKKIIWGDHMSFGSKLTAN